MALVKTIARFVGLRPWVVITAGLVVLLAAGTIGKCTYDRQVIADHVSQANNQTLSRTIETNDEAASEQLADHDRLSILQRNYDDALHDPPAGSSLDPRIRIDCQRLRHAGYGETDLPAPCRYGGGRGTGTGADR
ncbi:hypothetical protein [Altericroceibacterium endophyticum]|uniref:Uncharacterized protein n=1 Tax=Altericroceibacterium endophyticum TaxID=1808508 RepID=A0A6I4T447_9SPHN|nr:hypothetical protein [Altericroceibacterium endophyticum]MXO64843.1 hypothetical protein [Altericroceibacterium endophyticum]